MNPEIRNILVNDEITANYTDDKVAKAVVPMTTQRQAALFNDEAARNKDLMEAHPVFDPQVLQRTRALLGGGMALLIAVAAVLAYIWPELENPAAASLGVLLAAAACIACTATSITLLWKAWTLRNHAQMPELSAADVDEALALRVTVGEQHKLPPAGWEKPAIAFARGLECAGFGYLALLGLGALPPFVALGVAIALGVVITGSVSLLGRLHAQREVITKGLTMYRARQQLANELKETNDPRAERYQEEAAQLREALSSANMGQFAAPSKLGVGALWVFVGLMIGLAMALRVLFGTALSAKAAIGAGMLAVATCLIFWASYRMSERFHSVAGDMGQRAMNIAVRFGSIAAFNNAMDQHRRRVDLLFRRVMLEAARVNQAKLEAQDPLRPRVPLDFEIPRCPTQLPLPPAVTSATVTASDPVAPVDRSFRPPGQWMHYAIPNRTSSGAPGVDHAGR